jgi:hypothetical protein
MGEMIAWVVARCPASYSRRVTTAHDWLELDGWGQIVARFHGTHDELVARISATTHPDGKVVTVEETNIYLRESVRRIRCTVVTMTAPWGRYRFIPKPTWIK